MVKVAKVLGPATAVIVCLERQSWNLSDISRWTDPAGNAWTLDIDASAVQFLRLVENFALLTVWDRAAQSWCGKGAELGICWQPTLALYKHIQDINDESFESLGIDPQEHPDADPDIWHEKAKAGLELLMVGGHRPAFRAATIHETPPECPRCGAPQETAFHLLWVCPANASIQDKRVSSTQALIPQAREQVKEYPVLWLRGL